MKKSKRLNHYIRLACLTGALFCYSASAFAVVMPNTQLPQGGEWVFGGSGEVGSVVGNNMTITQDQANAIIKWSGDVGFNIGSIASVEFKYNDKDKFNILNYDASGVMSQIRGTLKAENGNVYIVNPAGVFIGNSAQVDVGSLYVSNKKIELLDKWKTGDTWTEDANAPEYISNFVKEKSGPATSAELMSLGHINATNVTFDGNRIVLDTELLTTGGLEHPMEAKNILIKTDDSNKVVIGYDAYDEKNKTYAGKNDGTKLANLEDASDNTNTSITKADGYMWVRDLEQLQAMNTNKSGNYALRNGIGAISTKDTTFVPIGEEGIDSEGKTKAFTGKFDGLAGNVDGIDFAIFDLHVTGDKNLGLFGVTDGAEIRNVLLTGGEVTGTGDNIGALVGLAKNTTIENVRNSINVIGGAKDADGKVTGSTSQNVGGIVGSADGATKIDGVLNTGDIQGFANVGGVVGGIDGDSARASISNAENIGRVQGADKGTIANPEDDYSHNIGGIAGSAKYADISDVENNLQIVGGYNVGGIVGSGENVTIKGAVNNADVTATGYTEGTYKYKTEVGGVREKELEVLVANVGGIAGSISGASSLTNVTNDGGNIKTSSTTDDTEVIIDGKKIPIGTYYHAGNVGGIVGSAGDNKTTTVVTITNAENKENTVYGAHNVGGIAGYLENGTITLSSNNGGEITGTGARTLKNDYTDEKGVKEYENNFAYESIRTKNQETFLIGNMGGSVGYMYGNNAFVSQSGNRGNVHSQTGNMTLTAKAANVGGIVGKIYRSSTKLRSDLLDDKGDIKTGAKAAIMDCYNRGNIQGYTGVGGVVGMMYNGEVIKTDNSGTIETTRVSAGAEDPLNMGGIVGDTTEQSKAYVFIYDVHNDGVIGSQKFDYYGRHVGGVVGRLNGDIEKAYNTGAIYNAYSNTGGIVGYTRYEDRSNSIKDVFNTGNITVSCKDTDQASLVGGIVGGIAGNNTSYEISIENAYNLGILRSYNETSDKVNKLGGILGGTPTWCENAKCSISNVYTLGNIYSGKGDGGRFDEGSVGAIFGSAPNATISNAYYIKPEINASNGGFTDLALNGYTSDGAKAINFADRGKIESYKDDTKGWAFDFSDNGLYGNNVDVTKSWRIYNYTAPDESQIFTTPILNAFLPKAEDYFDNVGDVAGNRNNIASTQYGTAYNPLLTIINATGSGSNTVSFDWNKINPDRSASFAVFNGNLSISDFNTQGNLYGGTLYAKGNLSINNVKTVDGSGNVTNSGDVLLGSGAKLYGSTINVTSGTYDETTKKITSGGKLVNYGTIRSTGQVGDSSNITLQAEGDVEIIGEVTSNSETNVVVPNVGRYPTDPNGTLANQIENNIADKDISMPSVGDYYSRRFEAESKEGNVTITSQKGDVSVLLGVAEKGVINASNNLTITGQNVYVDSDLSIKGNFTINANDTVLDLSNIAKNRLVAGETPDQKRIEFLQHFTGTGEGKGTLNFKKFDGTSITDNEDNAKIMFDLWNDDAGSFELGTGVHESLHTALKGAGVFERSYVWVSNAKQLQGINGDTNNSTYNFALKKNIDAAEASTFNAIGTVAGAYNGKFNGRGNTIVGLSVDNDASAGLFSKIGTDGKVSDLNIYSSHFTGGTVGAVAGINKGTIDNVTTFGNRVNSNSTVNADAIAGIPDGHHGVLSSAGGITGINNGTISNAATNDAVATSVENSGTKNSFAGGIAGVNTADGAKIDNSVANSDITSTEGAHALGGIVGINSDNAVVDTVRSLGIVNGTYTTTAGTDVIVVTDNVGGIAGINEGGAQIKKAYNVAHVSGGSNVGGIVGKLVGSNTNTTADKYDLQEVVSAGDITSQGTNAKNVGGIVGSIENKNEENNKTYTYINSGRNTGEINGNENVGGLVGNNGVGSNLQNVINDANATITGEKNVGGIAGSNAGNIDAADTKLVNDGLVYGQTNVGGVAGVNKGTVKKTNSNITLYVKNEEAKAEYFGGAVGYNLGIINDAFNSGTIKAEKAEYVGGIVGYNAVITDEGGNALIGTINGAENKNTGIVIGKDYVGGIAGYNEGNIKGDAKNPTIVQNFGFVQAKGNGLDNGGAAGGVVGVNNVNENNIEFASLINSGIVAGNGKDGTGGVIGVNNGNITKASLIGTVDAIVVGKENVGGLIGINNGNVAGGRDTGGNYYAQQIYNNGKVIGGTTEFVDTLPDGSDANEWKEIGEPGNIKGYYKITEDSSSNNINSTNIGGLVGNNANTLIAGYNTGDITGGTNVGGIVGNNAGTVDQVFNASENVTGIADAKVVGRVIGKNAGIVTNAYDMGLGVIDNGDDKLVGTGSEVSIEDDKDKWYTYDTGKKYGTDKLLSVFLTKISFEKKNEIYANGKKQTIIAKAEQESAGSKNYYVNVYLDNGTFIGRLKNASNGKYFDDAAAHSLADFVNSKEDDFTSSLLSGASFTDAGTYKPMFYTRQISVTSKNHNNLGFYVLDNEFTVKPFDPNDPTNPDNPYSPNNPHNWQAEDKYPWYQWDKQRNERERKAEVHFVDGGMHVEA